MFLANLLDIHASMRHVSPALTEVQRFDHDNAIEICNRNNL